MFFIIIVKNISTYFTQIGCPCVRLVLFTTLLWLLPTIPNLVLENFHFFHIMSPYEYGQFLYVCAHDLINYYKKRGDSMPPCFTPLSVMSLLLLITHTLFLSTIPITTLFSYPPRSSLSDFYHMLSWDIWKQSLLYSAIFPFPSLFQHVTHNESSWYGIGKLMDQCSYFCSLSSQ